MTVFEERDRLKMAIKDYIKVVNGKDKRIQELVTQLADAQLGSRVKDRIIAEQEVKIDALTKQLRDCAFLGRSATET